MYRQNGAGEMLVFSAADLKISYIRDLICLPIWRGDLKESRTFSRRKSLAISFACHLIMRRLIEHLNVFEEINQEVPF